MDSQKEIVITRVFKAPRALVWKAWTDPRMIEEWWGPEHFRTRVEQLELRVDGAWRYVMIGPDGKEYPSIGVIIELVPYERMVSSDDFGEEMKEDPKYDLPKGIVVTAEFEDLGTDTKLTLTILHASVEDRIKHERMGVVLGWNSSFNKLDMLLQ